ncbi:hypothetical protein RIF29_09337 [Crotalaria pallida]|uniref:Uncharacterized protein n=1 Tax=Crotalaria pallida TaxID=3830 RepID=A0AAN9FUD1_CROPI
MLELILLKNKGVDRSADGKVTHVGQKHVIDLEAGNKDGEGNETLVPPMFQKTQSAVNSPLTLDFPPEMYANFILQVSDKEGSDQTNTFSTPNLKLSNLHRDSSGAPKTSKRRRFATSDVVMDLGRNIFPSPTSKQQTPPTQTKSRGAREISTNPTQNPSSKSASKGKGLATASPLNKQNVRPKSVTIPRALKTMFKPPNDIHFTLTEAMLFAFIFGVDMDLCEPLVSMGDLKLWRLDFLSFVPGKEITEKVFTVYALRVTLTQKYYSCVTTWHLPSSFAEDVKFPRSTKEMLEIYKETWMHLTPALHYIYVPLREGKH